MGTQKSVKLRVAFDTTTVVSALIFKGGRLAWLREHWGNGSSFPLISRETAAELTRVLEYPKFQLSIADGRELLAEYLPYCEIVQTGRRCPVSCRDADDQNFLDLAHAGKADVLVSGDRDLLVLSGSTRFAIETPSAYRTRVNSAL